MVKCIKCIKKTGKPYLGDDSVSFFTLLLILFAFLVVIYASFCSSFAVFVSSLFLSFVSLHSCFYYFFVQILGWNLWSINLLCRKISFQILKKDKKAGKKDKKKEKKISKSSDASGTIFHLLFVGLSNVIIVIFFLDYCFLFFNLVVSIRCREAQQS